jgi:hypothetical protein
MPLGSPRIFMPFHPFQSNGWVALQTCRRATSWLKKMPLRTDHNVDHDIEGKARPFPSTSTFFGIAAAMIALWLLASGLGQLFDPPARSSSVDTAHSDVVPAARR